MTEDPILLWHEKFWFGYPNDLCHKKKGSKVKSLNAARKIKDLKELDRIADNTRALIKYDRKGFIRNEQVDRWPHASTYLNQAYYDREIESEMERISLDSQKCKCGAEAFIHHRSPDKRPYCCQCYVRKFKNERKYLTGYGKWHNQT